MKVISTLVGIEIAVTRVARTESRKIRITMHREEQAEQALLRERLDRLLDVGRLVEDDGELARSADGVLEVGKHRGHRRSRRRRCWPRGAS